MPFVLRLVGGLVLLGLVYAGRTPINSVLRMIFDAVLAPFDGLHAAFGLTVLALPFAILALLLFKWTSDQPALERVKAKIHAGLFEIRLFNDDMGAIFRAQAGILGNNVVYFAQNLVPLLWMIGPFVLAMGQIQMHYAYDGLRAGEPALVKVKLADDWEGRGTGRPDVTLDVPDGLKAVTETIWMPARNEVMWKIAAQREGSYELIVNAAGEPFTKSVRVDGERGRRSPVRVASDVFQELLYPAEAPIPAGSAVEFISLDYPPGSGDFVGLSTWVWVWTLITMVIAFALRGKFGVTI